MSKAEKPEIKPIDHVTTDRLRAVLLALDVDLSEDRIELIIEVVELLEDTKGSPSLDQIIEVGETCKKERGLPQSACMSGIQYR